MTTVLMRHQGVARAAAWFAILAAVAGTTPGCKSGTSWTSKPSWWSFGGTPDAKKLADAPPAGDVAKPSTSAKPYPTTSTPEGYSLADAQRVEQASAAVPPPAAPPAGAITYGSTPPPSAPPAALPQATAPTTQPGGLSSITPQVGPYGSPPANPAAIDAAPTTVAAPAAAPAFTPVQPQPAPPFPASAPAAAAGVAAAAPPPAVPAEQRFGGPAERVADARSVPNWQAPAEAAPQAASSRYEAATGSRFSGGGFPATPAAAPAAPPSAPVADPFAAQPGVPLSAPSAPIPTMPPAAGVPAAVPPPEAPATALPPSAAPPVPTRRPDPGYRPGGTSSYRPSRTILAGGADAVDPAVQPASFQADAP